MADPDTGGWFLAAPSQAIRASCRFQRRRRQGGFGSQPVGMTHPTRDTTVGEVGDSGGECDRAQYNCAAVLGHERNQPQGREHKP